MESALYEGTLSHRRLTVPASYFSYTLFMAYLDLGELDDVFRGRWLWSTERPALAWFRRSDHYGDPKLKLDESIRLLVASVTNVRPEGPIRLLTHLRYFGYCFNPVCFYYCFAPDGRTLETVVAEVSNTPWGERHMYVLPEASNVGRGGEKQYELRKGFHVSPFLGMDMDYLWRFAIPGERLWVHMESTEASARVFVATLSLLRRPLVGSELARALLLRPAMTLQVVAQIYAQALRLWVRGAKFYPHPRTEARESP
jgi:DUF1365 family protein